MGIAIWLGFFLIVALVSAIPVLFRGLCYTFIAPLFTPKGHRRYGDYQTSEGNDLLRKDGFNVTPDWSSKAMKKP